MKQWCSTQMVYHSKVSQGDMARRGASSSSSKTHHTLKHIILKYLPMVSIHKSQRPGRLTLRCAGLFGTGEDDMTGPSDNRYFSVSVSRLLCPEI